MKLLCLAVGVALCMSFNASSNAQDIETIGNGIKKLTSPRLTIITDLPIDDELRSWPAIYDQAIEQWRQYFDAKSLAADDFAAVVHVIGDRNRFQQSGLMNSLPGFDEGYQFHERLFLVEQPSVYYRRHLFLHEGTHWAMGRIFDGAGPPWIMEGMADMLGTHRIEKNQLFLNAIPGSFSQVPQWGRFRIVKESIEQNVAPNLAAIFNYTNDRTNHLVRYAWSWAACVFFTNHPEYRQDFFACLAKPLGYNNQAALKLKERLSNKMPRVIADWNGFIHDFDFGFDPQRSMVQVIQDPNEKPRKLSELAREGLKWKLDSTRGWQAVRLEVQKGEVVHIAAQGHYTLRQFANAAPWVVQSQGVTLEYLNHHPLGQVIAAVVPIDGIDATTPWQIISIGAEASFSAPTNGVLMMKINESAGELHDNLGELDVVIAKSE